MGGFLQARKRGGGRTSDLSAALGRLAFGKEASRASALGVPPLVRPHSVCCRRSRATHWSPAAPVSGGLGVPPRGADGFSKFTQASHRARVGADEQRRDDSSE